MKKEKTYSLNKSHQILKTGYQWYKKRRHLLDQVQLQKFEGDLEALEVAILANNGKEANQIAHRVEDFYEANFKKSVWQYFSEIAVALTVALLVATIVRQSWFELYEIPTGSMRPTFKEQDHLTVTKTAFGINVPLMTDHFYFEPQNVQRTGIVIWSGDGVPHLDTDTDFMGIFPYTKRFIKRCMGKPGDTLYFYGGKIFGFDSEGRDLVELRNEERLAHLDHVPFVRYEGRESFKQDKYNNSSFHLTYHHFNQAIGRMNFNKQNFKGEVFNGKEWIKDNPEAQKTPHNSIKTYSDYWGIRNFAIGRLLKKEQLESLTSFKADEMEEGLLYLELRHTPSLSYPAPLFTQRGAVGISGYSTVIPLQQHHLNALMDHMYTCRFVVYNGHASSYGSSEKKGMFSISSLKELVNTATGKDIFTLNHKKTSDKYPLFPNVANGTYEFYYGKGVKVGWGAITHPLAADDILLSKDASNIQRLFNVGIDMVTFVEPTSRGQVFFPNRYIYFRDGNLYSMGGVLMEASDPILKSFNEREKKRESNATEKNPYVAFKDYGPPLTPEGQLDKEFIKTFGLKIPEKNYLMLGDNHAMSQDSRYFGPVPEANLQGAPSLILWPPGERWGIPNQIPYPLFTISRLIVWGIIGLILVVWLIHRRKNRQKPIFKKLP